MRQSIVLVANDIGGVGGMEHHLEEMVLRLRRDYDVTVITSSFRVPDAQDVRYIHIPVIRKPFAVMILMFSVLASLRLLFVKRNAIVHTTGAIVFNRVDLSTIHFCHAGFREAATRWKTDSRKTTLPLAKRMNAKLSLLISLQSERFCYRPDKIHHLVAVSGRIGEELQTFCHYPVHRIHRISNGVDTQRFAPKSHSAKRIMRQAAGFDEDGTYLIFMGGDWDRKGLHWVVGGFNQLAEEHRDLHLLIVGSGNTHRYQALVHPQYRNRVHFLGKRSNPEDWYAIADIFVFPSQYEACSLAVLEAAASGLALVVTNVGGAGDIVEDGVSGMFVQGSSSDIATKVGLLLDNPAQLQSMGQAVRQRVEQLTWDHTYASFCEVYRLIQEERRSPTKRHTDSLVSTQFGEQDLR